jgi:hypothetical protein
MHERVHAADRARRPPRTCASRSGRGDLDKTVQSALSAYMVPDKGAQTSQVAQKIIQTAKAAIQQSRAVVDGRVQALEAQASAGTAADAVLHALRPYLLVGRAGGRASRGCGRDVGSIDRGVLVQGR